MSDTIATYGPGLWAAYAILFVAASSPGPAVALLLGVGANQGRTAAAITTVGICCGGVTLNLLTLWGLGLLIEQFGWVYTVIRMLGAAYLLWLAYAMFKTALKGRQVSADEVPQTPPLRLFWIGYALQVTNLKAIVFWVAIQAAAGLAHAPLPIILMFFAGAFLISFLCHGAWAFLFSSSVFRSGYERAHRAVEAVLGTFLAFMAFRMATGGE